MEKEKPEINDELLDIFQSQNMGEGNLEIIDEEDELEENEPEIEMEADSEIEFEDEYADDLLKDIMANPSKYRLKSKKHGEMNLKDALDDGYNPETDEFDREPIRSKEEMMEGLSDSDKEAINHMTDPRNANIPDKDAEAMGIDNALFSPEDEEELMLDSPEEDLEEEDLGGLEELLGGMM